MDIIRYVRDRTAPVKGEDETWDKEREEREALGIMDYVRSMKPERDSGDGGEEKEKEGEKMDLLGYLRKEQKAQRKLSVLGYLMPDGGEEGEEEEEEAILSHLLKGEDSSNLTVMSVLDCMTEVGGDEGTEEGTDEPGVETWSFGKDDEEEEEAEIKEEYPKDLLSFILQNSKKKEEEEEEEEEEVREEQKREGEGSGQSGAIDALSFLIGGSQGRSRMAGTTAPPRVDEVYVGLPANPAVKGKEKGGKGKGERRKQTKMSDKFIELTLQARTSQIPERCLYLSLERKGGDMKEMPEK